MLHVCSAEESENLLSADGNAVLYSDFLSQSETLRYFETLLSSIDWKQDEVILFGKRIITSRKVGWYGDFPYTYIYSRTQKIALPWTPELQDIKTKVEKRVGSTFNSCLLNLYHNGSEGMGWHADDERSLDPSAPIASVSLGATRTFRFKHKTKDIKSSVELSSGSLLVMHPPTQEFWVHMLTKTARLIPPRINLTFRAMLPQNGS
jgi:alkylated DNA repair dioxygenase AlkB